MGSPGAGCAGFLGALGAVDSPSFGPPPRVVSPLCYGSWTPHLAAPPRCLVAAVTAARKHIPGPPRGPPDPARSRSSQGRGQAGGPARSRGGVVLVPPAHGVTGRRRGAQGPLVSTGPQGGAGAGAVLDPSVLLQVHPGSAPLLFGFLPRSCPGYISAEPGAVQCPACFCPGPAAPAVGPRRELSAGGAPGLGL